MEKNRQYIMEKYIKKLFIITVFIYIFVLTGCSSENTNSIKDAEHNKKFQKENSMRWAISKEFLKLYTNKIFT